MLIVDAHEDLAFNILAFGRDYTRSAAETWRSEAGGFAPLHNDDTLLGWPEYRRGRVALVFATLFAPPERAREGTWENLYYTDSSHARRIYMEQMDVYQRLRDDHPEQFRIVRTSNDLTAVVDEWHHLPAGEPAHPQGQPPDGEPPPPRSPAVGLVLLMEGAECIGDLSELEEWWQRGLRLIGPAWRSNRFCGGTGEPGPLTSAGFALLDTMASLGFGLDLSHMDEKAVLQALDVYPGPLMATHANALALLKGSDDNRHLSDRVIHGILERNGVIGVVPFNSFLKAGWRKGDRREEVGLGHIVAQIDYLCQLAGDARHVGIGSDFDGGFGWQSVPSGIDSIADLQKLAPLLSEKGYSDPDIAAILGENWISILRRVLPDSL